MVESLKSSRSRKREAHGKLESVFRYLVATKINFFFSLLVGQNSSQLKTDCISPRIQFWVTEVGSTHQSIYLPEELVRSVPGPKSCNVALNGRFTSLSTLLHNQDAHSSDTEDGDP